MNNKKYKQHQCYLVVYLNKVLSDHFRPSTHPYKQRYISGGYNSNKDKCQGDQEPVSGMQFLLYSPIVPFPMQINMNNCKKRYYNDRNQMSIGPARIGHPENRAGLVYSTMAPHVIVQLYYQT